MIILKTPSKIISKNADTLDNKHVNDIVPVGSIVIFPGNSIPENWMLCAGYTLERLAYPELFAVIGASHSSDNINYFNVPDLRETLPGINFIIKVN